MAGHQILIDTRVLIIEDEYFIMEEARRAVEDAGGIVVGAHAGLDDEMFDGPAISSDVAILDINVRGQMSYPLAHLLLGRGVPFIFATGYDFENIPSEFAAVPKIQKPFDAQELVKAIADACARSPAVR